MPLRVFSDRRCLAHAVPVAYPETPARLESILDAVSAAGLALVPDAHHEGAREAVLAIHSEEYVARFERAVARGDGILDSADNPLSPGTATAAWAAVEVVLSAADWMMAAPDRAAFAAVRPPGHHAERSTAMGFCFFNNVAVGTEALLHVGLPKVAIVDFDVHHGNLFEDQENVFYASLHLYPFYPGTGGRGETGVGPGAGTTLNVPLAPGSGNREYEQAFHDQVLPALSTFAPDALLVSAGFDAWAGDPLGAMTVDEEGFRAWGRWLAAAAHNLCEGRLLAALEGGYDIECLGSLVVAFLQGIGESLGEA
jgi:acetoin utilization deacetylase AcuC-like enzyme